ncbi:type III-B CRISPR module RAMP protein Cmr4 [Allochromatium vinosum]|uniref:CRISPR-associated RAMP protein, Cmr4 family n=1 Tax=Allochromatium vinosum (strain ATCC 17899 / DSM 180 / NBRC 103801 / NCIMB 10441 / D) TaxID=572477 RepID=D3RW18_ALLVD|nr:type III-B CRISPR module RAMP protein Cmr4 [Allochromatium vinosum]ADC64030.1 CRISPR-associated RAMP protein, Cmr4 family [Allochromatium vinosum DSM 180]
MHSRLFHLHTLSALHCGTGQSVGVVDLPIARARATQLPIVPGSSLRGVLRQEIGARDADLERALFGPRTVKDNAGSFAGALAVGDAHLLAMPVRALAGILCYVTAPFILRRYARDLADVGLKTPEIPSPANREHALVPTDSVNLLDTTLVLEDLDLGAQRNARTQEWAMTIAALIHPNDATGQRDFIERFAILPDDILGYLSETATELRTRISIDQDTGTVKKGALWFEEHLPAESVLWGLYALSDSNEPNQKRTAHELAQALPSGSALLQLGGQAGVGRGLVRLLTQEVAA